MPDADLTVSVAPGQADLRVHGMFDSQRLAHDNAAVPQLATEFPIGQFHIKTFLADHRFSTQEPKLLTARRDFGIVQAPQFLEALLLNGEGVDPQPVFVARQVDQGIASINNLRFAINGCVDAYRGGKLPVSREGPKQD